MTRLRANALRRGKAAEREWQFRVRRCRNGLPGFVAWCARTHDLGNGPLDVSAAEETHFEYGPTAEEALGKLKREVLQ